MIHYLTKDDLLDLHAYAVERYGGLLGIKSQDRLQTVLSAPQQEMFGAELYPDLCSKAAVLVYMLVKSHPFVGANDATALLVLLRFLEINGAALQAAIGAAELAWIFRALNHSDLDKAGLEQWLRESVVQPEGAA
ncbi:type II toxin-antitoxin system death-on-curing family toxin [Candidatus Chloroploca asiatica]|uniref:Death-on-curing protein n=1 Tax=Candidatus Chloroploca asiatica TaxID=1506545 RepID=A0A2H3KIN8_9CHLR|nr:type II toxin-antitoxin system death-on-curing family toxin [Candidatus Chloroploca asiatica]PDV96998.1 death-on-curing protein [Candidatus Chloroploca asiatica]